ncbi:YfgM family protein [Ramlibacter pallidus]|uniref:Ancillary SecYEG translocon subunit n=1 Tax=Ramlibacter pallidus TaxID=2780087 RepID=A0ABR9S4G8_9BURK|nr:tetratricopeptide repeat protein [Ramlibacter pallidus]MBE7368411.1 tetratricopeptide repeat protein [Ramlibacter pallidus]
MARHLDLEEQEQLDELKHFWKQWGNLITWFLIAVLGAFAAWNGWQYWQRQQAVQAAVLYDEVERAVGSGDAARVEQAVKDVQDKFGRTAYAQQAALLGAKFLVQQGKADAARAALQGVAEKAGDEGYQALARLRLAALLVEAKSYDEALKQLTDMPAAFEPLAADRRGDILKLQGKNDQAKAEYTKAWQGLGADAQYRSLVEVKLTALGVDVQTLKAPAETAKS